MSEKIRSYLLEQEKNQTRSQMARAFASVLKAKQAAMVQKDIEEGKVPPISAIQNRQQKTTLSPADAWLTKKDLSKLYLKRPDGFRRAQFLELVLRLAMEYLPELAPDKALYEYLLQIFPRIPLSDFEDKPFLKQYELVGKTAYVARYLTTPQLDQVLLQNKHTIQKLTNRMDTHMGVHLKMNSLNYVFSRLFPTYKAEIHTCFVTSIRIVSEEKDSREAHFRLTKAAFYEFLIRLSRVVVCGSSTYNYISYDGIPTLYAARPFAPEDFVEPETEEERAAREKEEKLMRVKGRRQALIHPPAYNHEAEEAKAAVIEDAGILTHEEGYLPYHVTLDILFKQIEQKLQYL